MLISCYCKSATRTMLLMQVFSLRGGGGTMTSLFRNVRVEVFHPQISNSIIQIFWILHLQMPADDGFPLQDKLFVYNLTSKRKRKVSVLSQIVSWCYYNSTWCTFWNFHFVQMLNILIALTFHFMVIMHIFVQCSFCSVKLKWRVMKLL